MKTEKKINILFITFNDISKANFGGAQCSIRNIKMLSEFSNVDTYVVKKRSTLESVKSILSLSFPPFGIKDKQNILQLINEGHYNYIFCDHSLFGNITKYINEKLGIPVIIFFHNVELDYINVRFGKKLQRLPYKYLAWINEKKSVKYSEEMIVLNKRDEKRIKQLYGRRPDFNIPITFKNMINTQELLRKYQNIKSTDKKTCLFVGAYANSNYEGIKWFVENIADKISVNIKIVGKGFEKKKEELTRENVEVVGFVEDLEAVYLEADCVISPILFGGGMKVKIAEALMYGKTIFGTTEAFEGYEIKGSKIGEVCNTADEFVEQINKYMINPSKYNKYSRQLYEEKYTDDIALTRFERVFETSQKR